MFVNGPKVRGISSSNTSLDLGYRKRRLKVARGWAAASTLLLASRYFNMILNNVTF